MSIFKTKYQRISLVITSLLLLVIMILIYFFGLTYLNPPLEYGIELNFGTSHVGTGKIQATGLKKIVKNRVVKESKNQKTKKSSSKIVENILTQKTKKNVISVVKKKKTKNSSKTIHKPTIKPQPKPDKSTTKALSSILNALDENKSKSKSDGDDFTSGDKGNKKGNLKANGYYKVGGKGFFGNYNLGNRKPLNKPVPIYDCNEEGKVVVRIIVDKNGIVTKAEPGVKGSTNSTPCLLKRAKEAALKTLWQKDSKAPDRQVGIIIYNFEIQN